MFVQWNIIIHFQNSEEDLSHKWLKLQLHEKAFYALDFKIKVYFEAEKLEFKLTLIRTLSEA